MMENDEVPPQQQQRNSYLDQVLQEQEKVAQELRRPRKMVSASASLPAPARRSHGGRHAPGSGGGGGESERAIDVRITGFWRWKTVIVPPNVYVVHTRRGHAEPVHVGMGVTFRFDPELDAFLVIPAAMQTIIINARCICAERQGILVQAYVQWIIDDIQTAYRKLDFSDDEEPMRIVNVQLREQAEAAIKDKVSTMRIDEVLADKRPIIEELTHRLREVAEGSDSGLGLKIVTVQIKEAVVSSARLWENLQKPFRAEQEKIARLAELGGDKAVRAQELTDRKEGEIAQLRVAEELGRIQHDKDVEDFDRRRGEEARRHQLAQEAEQRRIGEQAATEVVRREKELAVALRNMELAVERMKARIGEIDAIEQEESAERARALAKVEGELLQARLQHEAAHAREAAELENLARRRKIDNEISPETIQAELVRSLPEIASKLPAPDRLERIHISSDGGAPEGFTALVGLVTSLRALLGLKGAAK